LDRFLKHISVSIPMKSSIIMSFTMALLSVVGLMANWFNRDFL